MKLHHRPDNDEIRRRRRVEFSSMDGDLLDALVDYVVLCGNPLPSKLQDLINKRRSIKNRLPKVEG